MAKIFFHLLFLFSFILLFNSIHSKNLNPYLNFKINYTESTETIKNPGMGYTTTHWLKVKRNTITTTNIIGSLVLMFIDIGEYSSGINEEKIDYDFDSTFFETLRQSFENCRKNGATLALRFRYDADGKPNPEPKSFEQILKHISQIKDSGLFDEYKDILMFVEMGFLGAWGELHSSKYNPLEYKVQLLDYLLDRIPDNIPVTVRTPNIIAKWLNISENQLDTFIAEKGSRASRVGLYNDGYMGSNTDYGTYNYQYRNICVNFFYNQMRYTYFGGEFSGDLETALKYDTYKPENSIKEMYKTHLSYINGNIFKLYQNYTFEKQYDVENVDNSAYYGQTVFKFIRDHLGYRLVLRKSNIQKEVEQGGIFEIKFIIENTGFANPIRKMNSELILEKNGNYMRTPLDVDVNEFFSCTKKEINLKIKIPGQIDIGLLNIFFKIYIGNTDIKTYYMRSVQFSNNDIYESNLGANYLGNINVISSSKSSIATEIYFYQDNSKNNNKLKNEYKLYNLKNIIKIDGLKSDYEWTEDLLIAENGNNKLYAKNDEKFLYVMADIKQNASYPIINIQISHTNEWFWLYYGSGILYFNKGNENSKNWLYMNNNKNFEFKIPLEGVMNMNFTTKLDYIRVSIQDYANGWVNCGEIKSGEYNISFNFNIYTAFRKVIIQKDKDFIVDIDISLDDYNIQWLLNGNKINNGNEKSFKITKASEKDIGLYSAHISTKFGYKIVDVCNIDIETSNQKTVFIIIFSIIGVIIIVVAVLLIIKCKSKKKK